MIQPILFFILLPFSYTIAGEKALSTKFSNDTLLRELEFSKRLIEEENFSSAETVLRMLSLKSHLAPDFLRGIHLELLKCHLAACNCSEIKASFSALDSVTSSEMSESTRTQLTNDLFSCRCFDQLPDLQIKDTSKARGTFYALTVASFLHRQNIDSAIIIFNEFTPKTVHDSSITPIISNWISGADNISVKSKPLAIGLSALLPGAGKIYLRRNRDGVTTLLTTAFCTWQCVDGYNQKGIRSAKGWLFSLISSTFYIANLYGTSLAVDLYNNEQHMEFLKNVDFSLRFQILGN